VVGRGRTVPWFCIRKAFAACVYRSTAFSYFSVRPPKKEKPPPAEERALSACCGVNEIHSQSIGDTDLLQ
jgi:hypothetical protein